MIQGVLTLLSILPVFTSCSDSDSLATPSESTQGKLVMLPQGVVSKGYTMQTTGSRRPMKRKTYRWPSTDRMSMSQASPRHSPRVS